MSVLTPPTFNGVAIFGYAWKMRAGQINPVAAQTNSYPGQHGLENLNHGLRGGKTQVTGRLRGANKAGLLAAIDLFRSYYDGRGYVLVDQFEKAWPFTKLETFEMTGPIIADVAGGYMWVSYSAVFTHLFV